jgi:hypothetical protein
MNKAFRIGTNKKNLISLNFEFLLVLNHDKDPQRGRFWKRKGDFETQSLEKNRSFRYLE